MIPLVLMAAAVQPAPFAVDPVGDEVLAEQRGGFRLPSGIDVALTVQTQTAVDGAVVLRSVFRVDQGPAQFAVYAPRAGERVAAPATSATAGGASAPSVVFDARGGIRVTPGFGGSAGVTVTGGNGGSPSGQVIPAGLERVGSAGAVTDSGQVASGLIGDTHAAVLCGTDLTITHLAGGAYGSVIANTGNDRLIDTVTTVSIDLANAGPDVLGSTMFRVEGVAVEAMGMRF